ncbi:hypothetical protein EVAR_88372_1 [Eumeta japonica]|uniref:Uncharacterized protein n=1 Tax=Eumeta variegata TaxID=151549 RepID=A0A4C1XEM7_EUMVA|nr:hypothetical protein EVAR_88372_1 [Eumeta japonica]
MSEEMQLNRHSRTRKALPAAEVFSLASAGRGAPARNFILSIHRLDELIFYGPPDQTASDRERDITGNGIEIESETARWELGVWSVDIRSEGITLSRRGRNRKLKLFINGTINLSLACAVRGETTPHRSTLRFFAQRLPSCPERFNCRVRYRGSGGSPAGRGIPALRADFIKRNGCEGRYFKMSARDSIEIKEIIKSASFRRVAAMSKKKNAQTEVKSDQIKNGSKFSSCDIRTVISRRIVGLLSSKKSVFRTPASHRAPHALVMKFVE